MLVYAGAVKNSDGSVGEGALLVFSIETDAAATLLGVEPIGTFAAPSNADPLEIVSVDGDTLTLRTEAGDEFVFDAVTREFVAGP
jgi:hypothetical protein